MNCSNKFCCYFSEGKCTLSCISHNDLGICDSQMIVTVDDGLLELERKILLAKLDAEEKSWAD